MSGNRGHSRHLTWPVSFELLPNHVNQASRNTPIAIASAKKYKQHLPDISENDDPFSHFLSPLLDDESDVLDETSYSAGITPYIAEPKARRNDLFRARLEEKWEGFAARRLLQHAKSSSTKTLLPAPLPPPFPQHHIQIHTPEEDALPDLMDEVVDEDLLHLPDDDSSGPSTPEHGRWSFPSSPLSTAPADSAFDTDMDGWEADRRLMAGDRKTSRRPSIRSSRTLSGKRHSWREPSEELYTLSEESEDDEETDNRRGRSRKDKARKKRKMVHWDEEVQVVEYQR